MAKPKARPRRDTNHKNRSLVNRERHLRLEHKLMKSAAFCALAPNSRVLLDELAMIENGENNGKLWLSVDDATARMGLADRKAAMAAFDQLSDLGFIRMTREGSFRVKAGIARARWWRLTWIAALGKGPTHDYRELEPAPQTPARKRMERRQRVLKAYGYALPEIKSAVEDSSISLPPSLDMAALAVEDCSTGSAENGGKVIKSVMEDSSIYTTVTTGYGETAEQIARIARRPTWAEETLPHLDQWARKLMAEIANDRTCGRDGCTNRVIPKRTGLVIAKRYWSPACQKAAENKRAYDRKREVA